MSLYINKWQGNSKAGIEDAGNTHTHIQLFTTCKINGAMEALMGAQKQKCGGQSPAPVP